MASLDELISRIPPPTKPLAASGDWDWVERELGLRLPTEFKQIIETYGTGKFYGFLRLNSPFVTRTGWTWLEQIKIDCENFRTYAAEGMGVRYPVYPQSPGLVPFGGTENCNYLCWLSDGSPEDWGLVIWDECYLAMRPYLGWKVSDLLVEIAQGRNPRTDDGDLFPEDLQEHPPFTPIDYDAPPWLRKVNC